MGIGALLGSLGGVLPNMTNLFETGYNTYANERNYRNMVENQRYQQWVQLQEWNREDSSIQRRVQDLRAAGLSPVLAAGQGASSGAVVNVDPAQRQQLQIDSRNQMAELIMQGLRMDNEFATSQAQRKLYEAQALKAKAETAQTAWNTSKWMEYGFPTNYSEPSTVKLVRELMNQLNDPSTKGMTDKYFNRLPSFFKGIENIISPSAREAEQKRINQNYDDRESERLRRK